MHRDRWSLIHNANIISAKIAIGHDNIGVSTFDEDNRIAREVEIMFLRSSHPEIVDKYVNLARESLAKFSLDNSEFLNWSLLKGINLLISKKWLDHSIRSNKIWLKINI